MVLGLAAAAVELLVQRARRAAGEVGDDEAGVGALRAGLDAGDDALDPAPAGGAVVEFLVAPQLVRAGRGGLPGRGAALQGLDMAAQRRGRGDAEDEIDAARPGRNPAPRARSNGCRRGAGSRPAASGRGSRAPGGGGSRAPPARSGRRAGRSMAATGRPSPSNTTIGWKPYSS